MNTLKLMLALLITAAQTTGRHWKALVFLAVVVALGTLERWPAMWCVAFIVASVGWMNCALSMEITRRDLDATEASRRAARGDLAMERAASAHAQDRAFARGHAAGLVEARRNQANVPRLTGRTGRVH